MNSTLHNIHGTIASVDFGEEDIIINGSQYAEAAVNVIIDNDMKTLNNLTVCAALLLRANNKGVNVDNEAIKVHHLMQSVIARQNEIRQLSVFRFNDRQHDDEFQQYVHQLSGQGIGAAPVVIWGIAIGVKYIIAASVIAGAIVTYNTIKYLQTRGNSAVMEFDESSKAIRDILDKLDAADRAALTAEIDKQLQNAYKRGRIAQWWHSWGSVVKTTAFIGLGAVAVLKGLPYLKKQLHNNK